MSGPPYNSRLEAAILTTLFIGGGILFGILHVYLVVFKGIYTFDETL